MLADPVLLTVLAYAHILSAVGWLGGGLLTAFVVGPSLQSLAPGSRLEFMAKVMPRIIRYVEGMVAGTLLFGLLLLYFLVDGDFSALSPSTSFGAAISAGMVMAVLTTALVFTVTVPSFNKVVKIAGELLKSGGQPPPEFQKYARRARLGSVAGAVLLVLVLACMVAAGSY